MPLSRRGLIAAAGSLAVPARAQPAAPLRIGVLTDLSGQYRDNSGPTSVLAARQAVEDFQPERHGLFLTEMKAVGLETGQDLFMTETFYWDLNDRTRAFTRRFLPKSPGNYPCSLHAGCYSAVLHYLKAVAAGGGALRSGRAAIAAMKAMPTDDDCFGAASIRADGRFLCDTHLFQVKTPDESKGPWDIYRLVSSTPGARAFRPLAEGGCTMEPI